MYQVYVVVNKANSKMYVGCTERTLDVRLQKHICKSNEGSLCSLHKAIRKYGKDNFVIRMIEEYPSKESMLAGEVEWIAHFDTYKSPNGYNDTSGGEGGNTNGGKKFSEEWKNSISKSKIGQLFTNEHKASLSRSHKNKISTTRKVTFELAEIIRSEYKTHLITQKQLGVKYGLSQNCIFNIIRHNTYTK